MSEEKMTEDDTYTGKKTPSGGRTLAVAVAASTVAVGVTLAVVISLLYATEMCRFSSATPEKVETFDVEIWERGDRAKVVLDRPQRLITTETERTDRVHHTTTLQDYNKGLQAIKDLCRKQCFILPVFGSFEDAERAATGNITAPSDTAPIHLKLTATKEPIPSQVLSWVSGEHVTKLCSDVHTFWLITPTKSHRQKRWEFKLDATIFGIKISIDLSGG